MPGNASPVSTCGNLASYIRGLVVSASAPAGQLADTGRRIRSHRLLVCSGYALYLDQHCPLAPQPANHAANPEYDQGINHGVQVHTHDSGTVIVHDETATVCPVVTAVSSIVISDCGLADVNDTAPSIIAVPPES